MLTLFQAEWCPFSSAVRELLTERGLDFVARQVEPWPEERARLVAETGGDEIPALVTDDGDVYRGTREIFAYLARVRGWEHAAAHRGRFRDHRPAREDDVTGQLLDRLPAAGPAPIGEVRVEREPERSRYVLRSGDRAVGVLDYRLLGDEIVFTHTGVDPACEGRGYGSRLVERGLDDARDDGLRVRPLCSFVAAYIRRHPEYADLVTRR